MTETALQGVTALHADVTALRQMAAARVETPDATVLQGSATALHTSSDRRAHLPRAQEAGLRPLRILVGRTRLDETQLA
jgi:hypothetical protein